MMNISVKVLMMLMAVLAFASCSSDDSSETANGEEAGAEPAPEQVTFTYESGKYEGIDIPYRKAVISPKTGEKAALVIYLHGGTSKGNDNEKPVAEAGVDSIKNYLSSNGINSVFIVPQCPTSQSWIGPMFAVLKALIDEQVASGAVDTGKIYLLGGSMGGTGTWGMLAAYPGVFTAAIPVAGNPSGLDASKVAQTPVYTVMGTNDRIMDIDPVQNFVNEISANGGTAKFDIEDGWTHEMTCIQSYTKARLSWLFANKKES